MGGKAWGVMGGLGKAFGDIGEMLYGWGKDREREEKERREWDLRLKQFNLAQRAHDLSEKKYQSDLEQRQLENYWKNWNEGVKIQEQQKLRDWQDKVAALIERIDPDTAAILTGAPKDITTHYIQQSMVPKVFSNTEGIVQVDPLRRQTQLLRAAPDRSAEHIRMQAGYHIIPILQKGEDGNDQIVGIPATEAARRFKEGQTIRLAGYGGATAEGRDVDLDKKRVSLATSFIEKMSGVGKDFDEEAFIDPHTWWGRQKQAVRDPVVIKLVEDWLAQNRPSGPSLDDLIFKK